MLLINHLCIQVILGGAPIPEIVNGLLLLGCATAGFGLIFLQKILRQEGIHHPVVRIELPSDVSEVGKPLAKCATSMADRQTA